MNVGTLMAVSGCFRSAAERFADPISRAMAEFGIDTPMRQAHFIAQAAFESGRFERVEENLDYSWQRLMEVWPNRFPNEAFARQYHRQPQRIANWVYASRMGNGPPSSGEGWRYRGRGLKQLTGRRNYAHCSNGLGVDLVTNPERLAEDDELAARSAAWYWSWVEANAMADENDLEGVTRAVNGGLGGLEERRRALLRAMNALAA